MMTVALAAIAFASQTPALPVATARTRALREAKHAARLFHPPPRTAIRSCRRRSRTVVDCVAGFTFPAGDVCTRSFRVSYVSVTDHRLRVRALGDPMC
jgi:hypothetical protein